MQDWLAPLSLAWRRALRSVQGRSGRRLACFDADGTLWSEDIGEAFLRWLIASGNLRNPPKGDLWEAYEERVRQDRSAGYTWAVQLMAGIPEADLFAWSRWFVAAWPNARPAMRGLIQGLEADGFEVWIVSASNRWTIRAASSLMGVPETRVIGIEVETRDGVLTDTVVHPVVCMAGKVAAIDKYLGARPVIACADSLGDLQMLEAAEVPLVVGRKDQQSASLLAIAADRNWPVHLF